ncbi:AAA family ATPase [Cellulomonas fimi]|uniref:AAA ATPase n=1 Tax=Cellulomonas fimi (strain ATCC 484 / DSM 20113 / JCM 1341 / CCUG 24087 / LMG 16345 / NBRC 15513 / NCIMB 8980 / NCTC 7547 / NRS-133) TaxID=590998 RepID=F4H2B6_CELFA|nr:AAA family ATPase [Cellulomonas fimi]AEE47536.1 AAA ATPase [Cellulomonas fimi ATCC 484]NNH07955.1 ATP-binding cassette domain-containing protein [Cellulomonas fimi]VEH36487.1 hemin importer ATP-binding subunit [Cellulomonas fimi]
MSLDRPLPVRRVPPSGGVPDDDGAWYLRIPAVRQVLTDGWDLDAVTVLVGENGAGKSTLVEALALSRDMGPEGGSIGSRHSTRPSEAELTFRLERDIGAGRFGFFLRAETMHSFYTYLEENPGSRPEPRFHEMSHGESFLSLVGDRMFKPGLYLLDEPEAALSFTGCLALLAHLHDLVTTSPAQVVLSTHSPILAALPGAAIWEVGEWGMRRCDWEDLDLVQRWRGFLDDPRRYLRHVID